MKNWAFLVLISTSVVFGFVPRAHSQALATIAGRLTDAKTGEGLVGATLLVIGTQTGAATDIDGKFSFKVPVGTYQVEARSIGYKSKRIDGVTAGQGQPVLINITLTSTDFEVKEVEIVANVARNNDNSLLQDQRAAAGVSSGVTAELLAKTPDRSISESFKRISGASVRDGKYAVVRGLQERYNQGQVNGMAQPSTEADRKAFSLDLFPTALVDKIVVFKTATPDLPGDFAGGVIRINTVDIPYSNTFTVSASAEHHSLTTGKRYLQGTISPTDFLGFDNGQRDLPKGIYSNVDAISDPGLQVEARQSRLQNNKFGPTRTNSAGPNLYFQAFLGRRGNVFGKNAGMVLGLNYYRTLQFSELINYQINTDRVDSTTGINTILEYDSSVQARFRTTSSLSGTANFSIRPDAVSKIAFRNLLVFTGSDLYLQGTSTSITDGGVLINQGKSYINYYDQNQLSTHQLTYERALGTDGAKVDVLLGASFLDRSTPDFKRLLYVRSGQRGQERSLPYQAAFASVTNEFNPNFSGKFYSNLTEESYNTTINGTIPVSLGSFKNIFKAGAFFQFRNRDYNGRNFVFSLGQFGPPTPFQTLLPLQGPDSVLRNENLGAGLIYFRETTYPSDFYKASSRLSAGYIMSETPFLKRSRAIYGVRIEQYQQLLKAATSDGKAINSDATVTDILPSINVQLGLTEKLTLRLAYFATVNRPEFREISPAYFFDPTQNATIYGNDSLKRAKIQNFDAKLEFYPADGATVSLNAFFKKIDAAIEQERVNASGFLTYTYNNIGASTIRGLELELRSNLGFVHGPKTEDITRRGLGEDFTFFANGALIRSIVTLYAPTFFTRPLQGQSPYTINTGITYTNKPTKLDFTVTANRTGVRIAFTGGTYEGSLWEKPRTIIDASVTYRIQKLTLKGVVGDVLAQDLILYSIGSSQGDDRRDFLGTPVFKPSVDSKFARTTYGRTIRLTASYAL
jgi:TonB-dependent receptor